MIKGNESDVENIDFDLQAWRGDKFLCFTLFWTSKNCSYLYNQMFDWDRLESKCSILNGQVNYIKKSKLNIVKVTHSPWVCHIYKVEHLDRSRYVKPHFLKHVDTLCIHQPHTLLFQNQCDKDDELGLSVALGMILDVVLHIERGILWLWAKIQIETFRK